MEWIQSFNIDEFHFLRPKVLWAFVPLGFLLLLMLISNREKVAWKKVIAPHLQEYMFTNRRSWLWLVQWLLIMISASFLIVACAGPTWNKIEIPGMKAKTVMVIGLDCSQSMMAEDIQPNRLERAKLKISDLLEANPGSPVGLIAYAGTAHPVVPPCVDYKLLQYQLNSLSPYIMPVRGSNLKYAIAIADSTLSRSGVPGTFLLITDNITANDSELLVHFTKATGNQVDILLISTTSGAKVPSSRAGQYLKDKDGSDIVSAPDIEIFNHLDTYEQITVHKLTLDNSDVTAIAEEMRDHLEIQLDDKQLEDTWEDRGLLFLWPMAVILLFWFRRGWVIQFCLLFLVGIQSCSPDSKHAQWWYTDDYIAQSMEKKDSFEIAAEKYRSLEHKGVAYFKAGNYEAAAAVFELDTTSTGYYNKALALAEMGQYSESIEAMNKAKELDNSISGADKLIAEFEKNQYQVDSIKNLMGTKTKVPETGGKKDKLETRKAKGKDEELTSDTETDELPDHGKRVTDEVDSDISAAEEMETPSENMEMQAQNNDAQNIMLRKISADPGEFLRRRFKHQKKKYYPDVNETNEKW